MRLEIFSQNRNTFSFWLARASTMDPLVNVFVSTVKNLASETLILSSNGAVNGLDSATH